MQNRFRVWNVELDSIENILNEKPIHLHFDYEYFVSIETISI